MPLSYKAVIVDLDRTLLRTDKSISDFTLAVLREWKQRGGLLLAATARSDRAIVQYNSMLGFDAVTTLNGAKTTVHDAMYECFTDTQAAENILAQLSRIAGCVISVETPNGIYANVDISSWAPKVVSHFEMLPQREHIYKILASHPNIPVQELLIDLPSEVYATVANHALMQIMSAAATKWRGIQKMLAAFEACPGEAIYFGDDNDDIEPMKNCGFGVAVANALDEVKREADEITDSNDADGVAKFIAKWMGENRYPAAIGR